GIRDRTVTGVQTCALPILCTRLGTVGRSSSCNRNPPWVGDSGVSESAEPNGDCRENRSSHCPARSDRSPSRPWWCHTAAVASKRSEERRVGKECGWRGGAG